MLEYFQDVVMLELSAVRVHKAKATVLEMWKGAASVITDLLQTQSVHLY